MWLRKRRVQWRIQSLADLAAAPPPWRHQNFYDHTSALTILSKPWTNTNFICARIGLFICALSSSPQAIANRLCRNMYENGTQT